MPHVHAAQLLWLTVLAALVSLDAALLTGSLIPVCAVAGALFAIAVAAARLP